MQPSPYPSNTYEELEAINVFESLVIRHSVIPHISKIDKVPNTDGHIEILDEQKRPVARLEVQVKKIPDGEASFSCPVELVAYSQRISLPFLLVCVDTGGRKAYFKHLHPGMPEFKSEQQTFTIHFDPKVNSVSPESQFVNKWLELSREYNKRVSDYPRLNEIVSQLDPEHVSKRDKIYFQEFAEHINHYLDHLFPILKNQYFNGVWKLGVAVYSADATEVCFQLFSIAPGDPDIRVTGISSQPAKPFEAPPHAISSWLQGKPDGKTVQYNWINRGHLKPAKKQAEEFIFKHLEKMLRTKSFAIYGTNLATEYLFWFVDEYGHTIGMEPADRLNVSELNYGISIFLPAWISLAAPRYRGELLKLNRHNPEAAAQAIAFLPFEATARIWPPNLRPAKEEVMRLIESGAELWPSPLIYHDVSIYSLMESVDYLFAQNQTWIERPYKPRSSQPSFIWSGYTVEELRHNVGKILTEVVQDYRAFITGNRISFKNSLCLEPSKATIYSADLNAWAKSNSFNSSPILKVYFVANDDRSLPAFTFVDISQCPEKISVEGDFLAFGGVKRKLLGSGGSMATGLFKDLPLRDRIYDLLKSDLSHEYGRPFLD